MDNYEHRRYQPGNDASSNASSSGSSRSRTTRGCRGGVGRFAYIPRIAPPPPAPPVEIPPRSIADVSRDVRARLLMSGVYLRGRTVELARGLMLKGQTYCRDAGIIDPAEQIRILSPIIAELMLIQPEEREFRRVIGDNYPAWLDAQALSAGLLVAVTGWRRYGRIFCIVVPMLVFCTFSAGIGAFNKNAGAGAGYLGTLSIEGALISALAALVVAGVSAWSVWPRGQHLAIPVKA